MCPFLLQCFILLGTGLLFIVDILFFCGIFITVDDFKKTEIPGALWDLMEPYSRIDHASGIAILAIVILILVLSNLASNVPTGKWMITCQNNYFSHITCSVTDLKISCVWRQYNMRIIHLNEAIDTF